MSTSSGDERGGAGSPPGAGASPDPGADRLERFRDYLRLQARIQLAGQLQAKIDPSDVVQETFASVCTHRDRFDDWSDRSLRAYLRTSLTHAILNQLRHFGRDRRDVARERPLEAMLDRSSVALDRWLAARGGTPSQIAQHDELVRELLVALDSLDSPERQTVVLQYWHGWKLESIAAELERSVSSVFRLARTALRKLRERLPSVEP